jgi:hypothetical protein
VSNGTGLEHLHSYSINPITKINDIFRYTSLVDNIGVSIHINVADKCDQESLSEVISCTVMRSEGNITTYIIFWYYKMFNNPRYIHIERCDCPIIAVSVPLGLIALLAIIAITILLFWTVRLANQQQRE